MTRYPALTPETVRALMVHSASWTPAMLKQFNCDRLDTNKGDYHRLVQICGFGVPNLTRAMFSMQNDFTMVIEDFLQPYKFENGTPKNNEMKFYSLPFPKDELAKLGETEVEMRVTLSYFIEPNPSSRVHSVPSYRSHGLRFDVIRPYEQENHFKGRLTKAMREDDNIDYSNDGAKDLWWKLGTDNRKKGSIHSDVWQGTAAELARCNVLAVYPVNGWWKRSKKHEKTNSVANYSLLISIRTSVDVDLLTSVESKIASVTKTDISI
jgi:hypothetical protein